MKPTTKTQKTAELAALKKREAALPKELPQVLKHLELCEAAMESLVIDTGTHGPVSQHPDDAGIRARYESAYCAHERLESDLAAVQSGITRAEAALGAAQALADLEGVMAGHRTEYATLQQRTVACRAALVKLEHGHLEAESAAEAAEGTRAAALVAQAMGETAQGVEDTEGAAMAARVKARALAGAVLLAQRKVSESEAAEAQGMAQIEATQSEIDFAEWTDAQAEFETQIGALMPYLSRARRAKRRLHGVRFEFDLEERARAWEREQERALEGAE